MIAYLKQLVNSKILNTRFYLISANILLVFFLILLNNFGVLPIKNFGNFIFFTFLLLLLALYRPGWSFLFFVGTIALENINVAPVEIGINVRPYQLFAALTIVAILVRLLVKRLNFKLPEWKWIDIAVIIFAVAGFISSFLAPDKLLSFKQSIVAASFVAIYFLVRVFIQNPDDLKKIVPFFLSSSIIVIFYGIWQNVRFMRGFSNFETMPGRPNSTFTEPDWLAIFLVLLIAVVYSLIFSAVIAIRRLAEKQSLNNLTGDKSMGLLRRYAPRNDILFFLLLVPIYISLILTVSRSAWLGAAVVTFIFLSMFLIEKQWKQFLNVLLFIAVAIISSTLIVYIFNLTSFQLFNRFQSTGTGLQKITVSCDLSCRDAKFCVSTGTIIKDISELEKYNCRHINLEEIENEKSAGKYVTEIYRADPNVNVRSEIYQKSWNEIKAHPVFGIGWGNIGNILGKDERGATLNSSNIFLEVWLGSGILGLLAFSAILFYTLIKSVILVRSDENEVKTLGLFLLLGSLSIIIPNLFNAGILMGALWLFLGAATFEQNKL